MGITATSSRFHFLYSNILSILNFSSCCFRGRMRFLAVPPIMLAGHDVWRCRLLAPASSFSSLFRCTSRSRFSSATTGIYNGCVGRNDEYAVQKKLYSIVQPQQRTLLFLWRSSVRAGGPGDFFSLLFSKYAQYSDFYTV